MYLLITIYRTSQTTPQVQKDSLALQRTRLVLMMQKTKKMNSFGGSNNEPEEGEESEGEDILTRKHATCHSKSGGTSKPTMVKYYNGTAWKPILICSKLAFCCYTMLEHLFLLTDTHLEDAELILLKTVTDMKKKVAFDLGEFLLCFIGNKTAHSL